MPYSGPNDDKLPERIKALPEKDRAQWVARWNTKYNKCIDGGGEGATCEAEAFKLANGLIGNQLQFTSNQTAKVRREKLDGKEYLVAPVVAICEGVLKDELVTAEEIEAHFHSWDGRPFVIGHPKDAQGVPVSANEPETLAQFQIGQLFHTNFEDGKLKGELWVDLSRVPIVDGAKEIVKRLESGKLEVSTAYFRDREEKQGTWHGKEYQAIARNLKPDHLAGLLDVEGACSWQDGCGAPRVNEGEQNAMEGNNGVLRVLGRIASALGLKQISEEVQTMSMSKEQMAKALAADELVGLSEDALAGLDNGVLQVLMRLVKAAQAAKPKDNEDDKKPEPTPDPEPQPNEQPCENSSTVPLPPEVLALVTAINTRGGLDKVLGALDGVQANEDAKKAALVEELSSNSACAFTKEQLTEMPTAHLKALKSSLTPADYTGQGGGPIVNADEIIRLEMPELFAAQEQ